ncbi:hypothetical protein MG293_020189 [Ovis ammon polii]|uniref:U1-type domain-containing protein n=1 Tax=Ovis ammon polii TaxID=230172 RepID=A0AAD4Y0V3_OVIAM|nr:hypothetical protein MG293_020189 [Ovis ammon polii]
MLRAAISETEMQNIDRLIRDILAMIFYDESLKEQDSTCVQDGECEAEFSPDGFEEKPEKEKKQTSFTLCTVCNIQLNSTAQAQIHYNGKSHQKRVKQLSSGTVRNDSAVYSTEDSVNSLGEEKENLNDVMKMSEVYTVGYVCCAFNNISSLIFSAVQRTEEIANCANDVLISSSYFPQ